MARTHAFVFSVFCLVSGFPAVAMAACKGQIAGPVSTQSPYYYSSSCFDVAPNQVRLRHQVCSVSPSTVMFKWTKLNWVSGSSGIEFGGCLVRTSNYGSALRIGGSLISANVGQEYNTDVYVPDLKSGNPAYFDTIDGGGPRISGGDKEPFHFQIRYLPRSDRDKKGIQIRATMVGEKPVFFLVLPRTIKSVGDLTQLIADDYVRQIAPLVTFGAKPLESKTGSQDVLLSEFYKENNFADRGSIVVRGETSTASVDFAVTASLSEFLPEMVICLGQAEAIATCFQAGPVPQ